jgi:hypothetical protein
LEFLKDRLLFLEYVGEVCIVVLIRK